MSSPKEEQRKAEIRKRGVLTVNKKSVAVRQLETAILLWFDEGDPIAIHTLAVAANDCFHAMGKIANKPSVVQDWIESQSKGFQRHARDAQNFFKHGSRKLKGKIRYSPLFGEILMFDSVICYGNLFDTATPLMRLFGARFALENSKILSADFPPFFLKGVEIYKLSEISRRQFFEEVLPLFTKGS